MVVGDGSNCPQAERQTVKQSDNINPGKPPFLELTISYLTTNQSQPSKEKKKRGEGKFNHIVLLTNVYL